MEEDLRENIIEIEVSSKKIEKTEKHDEFYAYRGLTNNGWLDLRFTKACVEKLDEETKKVLKEKNFKVQVLDENLNINSRGKFDIIYITEILSAEKISYTSKKEKYFSK